MDTLETNLKSLRLDVDLQRDSQVTIREQQAADDRSSNTPPRINFLARDSLEFLRKLTTINVTTKLSDETLDEGNPCDAPSSYMHGCGVNVDSDFEHENLVHLRIHEVSCTPEKVANAIFEQKIPEHSCTECSYVASEKKPAFNLAEHIRKNHNFKAKRDWPGCIDQSV